MDFQGSRLLVSAQRLSSSGTTLLAFPLAAHLSQAQKEV